MRHLDLFSGIGGFALAAQTVWGEKYQNVGFCDNNTFCQKILKKHWPQATIYDDIRKLYLKPSSADLITGGFPCQPFSFAGERRGKDDERDLWPQMFRVISEVRPAWAVGENVAGFIGMELDRSISDLESIGYAVQTFDIPAVAVGAPHLRHRVWIVAHAATDRNQPVSVLPTQERGAGEGFNPYGHGQALADAHGLHGTRRNPEKSEERPETGRQARLRGSPGRGQHPQWSAEPRVGRVAHGIPSRVDRIKALGNAIVPQVAMEIFKAIKIFYDPQKTQTTV